MKSITTTYRTTNAGASRYSATDDDGNRVTISKDYGKSSDQNHIAAMRALCAKLGWSGQYQGGHTGKGMVFAPVDPTYLIDIPKAATSMGAVPPNSMRSRTINNLAEIARLRGLPGVIIEWNDGQYWANGSPCGPSAKGVYDWMDGQPGVAPE